MIALFPGQGSQHVGMCKELYQEFKVAREVFEEASDATGMKIKRLCFDGPESDLSLTENTQPCLLVASVAAFRVAQAEMGFKPTMVAGHSLGEYSALVAAGAIQLASAAKWVKERGLSMQNAVPKGQGTMAAILNLEDVQVEALCKEATALAHKKRSSVDENYAILPLVEPANYNAPGQLVIAGSCDAIAEAMSLIKSNDAYKGGRAITLIKEL